MKERIYPEAYARVQSRVKEEETEWPALSVRDRRPSAGTSGDSEITQDSMKARRQQEREQKSGWVIRRMSSWGLEREVQEAIVGFEIYKKYL